MAGRCMKKYWDKKAKKWAYCMKKPGHLWGCK